MSAQSMTALEAAWGVQRGRKAIKQGLASGELTLDEALTAEACWTMTVEQMLRQLPGWGQARAERVLLSLRSTLSPAAQIGSLTDRQRALLVAAYDREIAKIRKGRSYRKPKAGRP